MKTILAAVDNSPYTSVVAEYACDLASLAGAGVLAAYIIDARLVSGTIARLLGEALPAPAEGCAGDAFASRLEAHGREALTDVEKLCADRGLLSQSILERGRPAEALAAMAPMYDVAVVGSYGSEAEYRSSLLGSTAADFLRLTTRPVLLAQREHRPIQRAIVGYDASPEATRALTALISLAAAGEWRLTIVLAGDDSDHAAALSTKAAAFDGLAATSHEVLIRLGEPATVLLDLIDELSADLIAVGSRGLNKLAQLLMGSTSDTLARQAPVPVMVFK
jgi:nucleotide-binding universal stress UspA family protein